MVSSHSGPSGLWQRFAISWAIRTRRYGPTRTCVIPTRSWRRPQEGTSTPPTGAMSHRIRLALRQSRTRFAVRKVGIRGRDLVEHEGDTGLVIDTGALSHTHPGTPEVASLRKGEPSRTDDVKGSRRQLPSSSRIVAILQEGAPHSLGPGGEPDTFEEAALTQERSSHD